MIKVREVRVISSEGEQLGILDTREAIKRAEELGLDLVEVAPTAKPPVCRIMDFGKYKYEMAKKAHESRKHQTVMVVN
jgi:translation initiation factor IF-3